MLIGIDASRATAAVRTGTEAYNLQIVRQLILAGSPHRFRLYCRDEPPAGLFPIGEQIDIRVIRRARLWTHAGLGPDVRRDPPDVLFVPSHVIPWPNIGRTPSVVTVHDVGYLHYPEAHPTLQRLYLDGSTRHSTAVAARVIAVSGATRNDLVVMNHRLEQKIRVVHSGIDADIQAVKDLPQILTVYERYKIPGPYLLSIGSIHLRKNPLRLIEAFARVREVIEGLSLVLAGLPGWGYEQVTERVRQLGLAQWVLFPGYVLDTDRAALYTGARACVFPSLYEGFGFPVLEAMACGVPVVCSNTSSLPELVGDAALMVNPESVDDLTTALVRILNDDPLRETLIRRGAARVGQFSWEACARATLEIIEEAAR